MGRSASRPPRSSRSTARRPLGPVKMVNLIATSPAQRPERRVDCRPLATPSCSGEFRSSAPATAPRAPPRCSSWRACLKARRQLPFTIELLFLDGEEAVVDWQGTDHTYGSRHYVEAARKAGALKSHPRADPARHDRRSQPDHPPRANSTPWLTDIIWGAAKTARPPRVPRRRHAIEDDHLPFLKAGVPAVDIIDLDYPPGTPRRTRSTMSAREPADGR